MTLSNEGVGFKGPNGAQTATPNAADPAGLPRKHVPAHRRVLMLPIVVIGLAVLVVLSVAIGAKSIPISDVLEALGPGSDPNNAHVIWGLRVPRTVVGLCVGVALGVSGALIQALTRNPLADPGILGVNAGASFFVALGVAVFGVTTINGQVWLAFAGALVVTVAVYLVGSAGRGGTDPAKLTLAGVALSAVLTGLVSAMTLLDPKAFNEMRYWNVGSIVNRGWDVLVPVLPFLGAGLVLAVIAASSLNAIALGDDLARSLGTNVALVRVLVVLAVTLLAGGATAVAGPIGFIGLMIPHIARWITGPDQRWILLYTILLAPSLMLASDIIGRIVQWPAEFPVGIVTSFIGAPVLIVLVRRKKASAL